MVWGASTMVWEGLVRKLLRMLHGNALAYDCNNREVMKNLSQNIRCHSRHLKRVHWGQLFVSCECETWSFALRGEYIPKGFENGLLRIFGLHGEQKMSVIHICTIKIKQLWKSHFINQEIDSHPTIRVCMICAVERLILQVQISTKVLVRIVTFVDLCHYVQTVVPSLSLSLSNACSPLAVDTWPSSIDELSLNRNWQRYSHKASI